MKSDLLVIIPAYNEEKNISKVVESIIADYNQYDYVVINDGSTDSTYKVCEMGGYNVINIPVNLGLSGAFQAGMKYADLLGYDYAIQIDGDGQHNMEYVKKIVEKSVNYGHDITIGSRYIMERKPWNMRMVGSRIISKLIFITTKKHVSDPTSGMRLYNKYAIHDLAYQMNFGPEPDTISYMINKGYSVGEVQVYMNERDNGKSYLRGGESIKYMIRMCFSIILMKLFR